MIVGHLLNRDRICWLSEILLGVLLLATNATNLNAGYTDPAISMTVISSGSNSNQPIVVFQGAATTSVKLAATAANFTPSSYTWSQVGDTLNAYATTGTATFSSATTAVPQVTVTLPAIGIYQFQVVATDGTNTVIQYAWVNVWDNQPALNPNGVVGASPGVNPPTSVRVLSRDPGPFNHPRVLFSRADWAELSNKANSSNAAYSTEVGTAVATLNSNLSSYFDKSGTSMNTLATDFYNYGNNGYTTADYNTLLAAYTASGAPTGDLLIGTHPTSSVYDALLTAAYLAWIGTDPTLNHASVPTAQQSRFTYLATILAAAAKFELQYNGANIPTTNGHYTLALSYDLLYDWMTAQQQADTRNYLYAIGNGVYNNGSGGLASSLATVPNGNSQNGQDFPNLQDGIVMADLAIEGEQGLVPTSVQQKYYAFASYATGVSAWPDADPASVSNLHREIRANSEWNLTPWGYDANMVDYFQLGQNTAGPAVLAFARRGENQFVTTNFYQSCLHTIYNLCLTEDTVKTPNAYTNNDLYDHHDGYQMGDGPGGESAAYIVKYMYPDDPMIDYFYRVFRHETQNALCQAIFSTTPGTQTLAAMASAKGLGLTKFDPLRAVAVTRNGWGDNDLNLIYENRWDSDGHMHAERNNFSLYALGRAWSSPAGYHCTINDVAATVLIQNPAYTSDPATQGYIGQSPSSATQANGVAGNFPTPPGRILEITEEPNKLWTLYAGDASAAYNYGYISGSSTKIDTGIPYPYFTYPGLVGPLLSTDLTNNNAYINYLSGDLMVNQTGYNPVQYAIRSVLTVRGINPYVLVLDDINKDGTAHNYRWNMSCAVGFGSSGGHFVNSSNQSVYSSLAIQSGATATEGTLWHSPVDDQISGQAGLPRLLVRDVTEQSATSQPAMFIDDRPANASNGALTYGYDNNQKIYVTIPTRRLLIERDNVVAPKYKVLLYPYSTGGVTPLTSWSASNTVLTVNQQNGTVDTLTFDGTSTDHRTRLVSFSRSTGTAAPTVSGAANLVLQPTGANSSGTPTAVGTYSITAKDAHGNSLTPSLSIPSGSTFAVGTTPVVASVVDAQGQETTAEFSVTVDPAAPVAAILPGANQNVLSWSAIPGATSYIVMRSSVSGGPYQALQSGITTTTYTDKGLTIGTAYYYVVYAVTLYGVQSLPSAELLGVPITSTDIDIGNPSPAGTYAAVNGTLVVKGGGIDISSGSDSFNYFYRPWTGDGVWITHVTAITNTNISAKAGVMFRASLLANAPNEAMLQLSANGVAYQTRPTSGANTTSVGVSGKSLQWLKLVRMGDSFTGFYSPDAITWTADGSAVTNIITNPGYVGLAVCSHNNGTLCSGTFANTAFLVTPTSLNAAGTLAYSTNLNWVTNPAGNSWDATATQVESSLSGANNWTVLTSTLPATATAYTASGLALGTKYDFRVKTIAGSVGSDYATLTGITTSSVVPPAAPSALAAVNATPSTLSLNWTDNATNATGYTVQESLSGANNWTTLSSTLTGSAVSFDVSDLTPGTSYDFRVQATNAGGPSSYATLTFTTTSGASALETPTMPGWALSVLTLLLVLLGNRERFRLKF